MSAFWSWFIIVLVAINIVGCVWLLWVTAKRRPGDPAPEDTSHVWDEDLTEYNKPLPKWWINLFYITIVFSIGYLAWYPGMGAFEGFGGWTSVAEHDAHVAAARERQALLYAPFDGRPVGELAEDAEARRLGAAVYGNYCAACHGSDARGARGFPNLTNGVWQWGGAPEQVLHTILEGRNAAMAPMASVLGSDQAVAEVAVYVQSLAGQRVDPALAAAGRNRFAICAACHGPEGKGNPMLGAPNLTDGVWLYGSDFESIRHAIVNGRFGRMPAHRDILGETRARLVAAYVLSLNPPVEDAAATAAAGSP